MAGKEKTKPALANPTVDAKASGRAWCLSNEGEPTAAHLTAGMPEPGLAGLCTDKGRPRFAAATTDRKNTDPTRLRPTGEAARPSCDNARGDITKPGLPKARVGTDDSVLQKLRAGIGKPIWA